MLKAIFASDLKGGFGYCGRLPWPRIPEDMKLFREVTGPGVIVMGKATFESLPFPLPYRVHVVVTDNPVDRDDLIQVPRDKMKSIKEFAAYTTKEDGKDVTIIGGTSLLVPKYLKHCEEIYHTKVLSINEADTFIPEETLDYLETLDSEIVLETQKIITRKYTA